MLSVAFYLCFILIICQYGSLVASSKPSTKNEQAASDSEVKVKSKSSSKSKAGKSPEEDVVIPKAEGHFSPNKLNMRRLETNSSVALNDQVLVKGGIYWFGTQMEIQGKISPITPKDGAAPRKRVSVRSFKMDVDCVTGGQFEEFVASTGYITESELFRWSFVVENQASTAVKKMVDSSNGMGRVKGATHWLAVVDANWRKPFGFDTDVDDYADYPVLHVSYKDAMEYCLWAGRRLPTEKEWKYAARSGRMNQTYSWGDQYQEKMMNIWDGEEFPTKNLKIDGYEALAPVKSFPANLYGIHNLLGNVWEWVKGGSDDKHRILRGGSFIDSIDGKFNHAVMVSTRQTNTGDSAASNVGFRCAKDAPAEEQGGNGVGDEL